MAQKIPPMWAVQQPIGKGDWFTISGTVCYRRGDAIKSFSPLKEDWASARKAGYRVVKVIVKPI